MGVFVVQGGKVRKALYMIPMGVADEQVDFQLIAFDKVFAEWANAGAGIDN